MRKETHRFCPKEKEEIEERREKERRGDSEEEQEI